MASRQRNGTAGEHVRIWQAGLSTCAEEREDRLMNSIIYLVGLVVIVLAILSLLGLR